MVSVADIPQVGQRLTSKHVEHIYEAIMTRQANFPGEPFPMSMEWVMLNFGSNFTEVLCQGPEKWAAYAQDVVRTDGNPTCPSGHEVDKVGPPLRLFWLPGDAEISLVKLRPEDEGKLNESGA